MPDIWAARAEITVTVVDINKARIDAWNSDTLPIFEPGLPEVVKEARNRNLFFSTDCDAAVRDADMIFVRCVSPARAAGAPQGRPGQRRPGCALPEAQCRSRSGPAPRSLAPAA